MKRRIRNIILVFIAIITLAMLIPPTRSLIFMSVYSTIENSKSVMHKNSFKIDIPSSNGWYPFPITFNSVNFGNWSGTGAEMSIMYNFAQFKLAALSSDVFNPDSSKHSSFYGAYALQQEDGYYGYTDAIVDLDEIVMTFNYDYRLLVLRSIGCENSIFEVIDSQVDNNIEYLGMDGWTKIDAALKTNSMLHNYKENHIAYIQYGKPSNTVDEDFPTTTMYGRIYVKSFDDYNSTVIIYAMSPNQETINKCDSEILKLIKIKSIN